jgi:hypothetical protein
MPSSDRPPVSPRGTRIGFVLLFVAVVGWVVSRTASAASVTIQDAENEFSRFLNIRSFGGVDTQSDNLTVAGSPLNEGTVLVHRGLTAVSDAVTDLVVGADAVTASGSLEISRFHSGGVLSLTFSDNRATARGSFEFVVNAGGTEMVATLSGEREVFGNRSEVTWTLDGDPIGQVGFPPPPGVEPFTLEITREFARGTHTLEFEVFTEVLFNNNGNTPPVFTQSSIDYQLDVAFSTPPVPPPIPPPVRFIWTGEIPITEDVTLTNPNVQPGETWELIFTLEGDTPDSDPGHGEFIDLTITPTIEFSGGYSVPVSTLPGVRLQILFGTFQIISIGSLAGDFFTQMGVPFSTFTDDLPPDGTYTPLTLIPTESLQLTNSDGEIAYSTDDGLTTLVVARIMSVPSASPPAQIALALGVTLLGLASLKRFQTQRCR